MDQAFDFTTIDPMLLNVTIQPPPILSGPPETLENPTPTITSLWKHDFKMHTKAGYSVRYRAKLSNGSGLNLEHNLAVQQVPDLVKQYWVGKSLTKPSFSKLKANPAYPVEAEFLRLMQAA